MSEEEHTDEHKALVKVLQSEVPQSLRPIAPHEVQLGPTWSWCLAGPGSSERSKRSLVMWPPPLASASLEAARAISEQLDVALASHPLCERRGSGRPGPLQQVSPHQVVLP